MNKVLITGIEPFDGDAVNPSWQIAQALAGEHIAGAEIAALELPCVLGEANQQLIAAIEALQPLAVICLARRRPGRDIAGTGGHQSDRCPHSRQCR